VASIESLAKGIGDEVLGDVAVRLAQRATKAAGSVENIGRGQEAISAIDVTGAFNPDAQGYRATLLAPDNYANDPELFYGPFAQVGSYFKIGPAWTQFALDMVLDPLNFVIPGTGGLLSKTGIKGTRGLTAAGRQAELMSTLGKVAQAKKAESGGKVTGAMVVDEAVEALETAGRLLNVGPDELIAAAKGGDESLKASLKAASKLAPDKETGRIIDALRRDRDVLGRILDKSDDLVAVGDLPPGAFLQETLRGRLSAGQSRFPGLNVIRPANPVKDPLKFARQLVGFSVADDDLIVPGSRLFSEGLDKAFSKLPGEALPEGVQDLGRAESILFESRAFRTGDTTAAHAGFAVQALTSVLAAPGAPQIKLLGDGAVDEDSLKTAYNYLRGAAEDTEIDPAKFADFSERFVRNQLALSRSVSSRANALRNKAIEREIEVMRAFADGSTTNIDAALVDGWEASIRTFADAFSPDALRYASISPGNAIAARATFGTLMAHTATTNMRDVMRRIYPPRRILGIIPDRTTEKAMAEVLPRLIDHVDLWTVDALTGKPSLTKETLEAVMTDDIAESLSPLLRRTLDNHGGSNGAVAKHLLEGIHPEMVDLAAVMKSSLDAIGENLFVNEGITTRFIEDYFTRLFKANDKFFAQYGGGDNLSGSQFAQRLFAGDTDDHLLGQLMKADIGTEEMVKAAKEGKLGAAEMRRWSEAAAVIAEKRGLGELQGDGITAFAGYLDSVNKALLFNKLRSDMARVSPKITRELIRSFFGDKIADELPESALDFNRIVEGTLPAALRTGNKPLFREIIDRGGSSVVADLDRKVGLEALRRTLIGTTRIDGEVLAAERVANRLAGVSEIDGFKLVDSAGGPVEITADWVRNGVPDSVTGKKTVEALIAHDIKAAEIEQEIVDATVEAWLARDHKLGSAANAKRALAGTQRKFALADARTSVAKKLHGKASVGGVRVFDIEGTPTTIDASWVLDNQVPADVFGLTGRGSGAPKSKLSAAQLRQRIKKMVDAEAVSEKIRASVDAKVAKIQASASVKEGQAAAMDLLRESAEADAAKDVAKRFNKTKFNGRPIMDSATGKAARLKESWIRDPSTMPRTIVARAKIKKVIEREISAAGATRLLNKQRRISKQALRHAAQTMPLDGGKAVDRKKLWAFAPDFGQLQDVFRLYESGATTGRIARAYDKVNHALKGTLLLGDVFHYNVLATSQFIAGATRNPADILNMLRNEAGELLPGVKAAAFRSLAGGVAGGVAGSGLSEDEGDIATFSLAGAFYGALIGGTTANAKYARNLALNPEHLDTIRWMGLGGWRGRPDDRAIGVAQRGLQAAVKSLQGSNVEFLTHPVTGAKHILDAWDHQLWGVMHNGSKHFYFDQIWRREIQTLEASKEFTETFIRGQQKALKDGAKVVVPAVAEDIELSGLQFVAAVRDRLRQGLAREVMQTTNNTFGGQAMSNLLENPEMQRGLRRILLAPDWTLSQLAMTGNIFLNLDLPQRAAVGAVVGSAVEMAEMGFNPEESGLPYRGMAFGAALGGVLGHWTQNINKRMFTPGDVMAKEARRMTAAALVGGYVFVNVMNKGFTGHYAFENEEGQRLGVQLPGMSDQGRKRYLKLGKPWLEAWEFAGVAHADRYPLPGLGRTRSKLAVLPSGVLSFLDNKTIFGPIAEGKDGPLETAIAATRFAVGSIAPIGLQGPLRAATSGFEGGETSAGAIRAAGFQVSTGREVAPLTTLGPALQVPRLFDTPFLSEP